MRVHIIDRNRPWRPPENHMDRRVCPDCRVTVHGPQAQREHQDWHLHINSLMQEFAKRTGMTEEEYDGRPWEWGAQITGTEDAAAAVEG